MASVGIGAYAYESVENWAKLPPGRSFKEIGGVGVDRNDNVFVFNRGEHPMIVFDREGNFLCSFGEGLFPRAHGIFMAPDDTIWPTDDGDHTVRQCRASASACRRKYGSASLRALIRKLHMANRMVVESHSLRPR